MVRAREKEECWEETEPGCHTSQWEARAECGRVEGISLPGSDGSSPSLGCLEMRATNFSRKDWTNWEILLVNALIEDQRKTGKTKEKLQDLVF